MSKFLLIHGAYHGAWCWDEVKNYLDRKDQEVYTLDLPGHGLDSTPRQTVDIKSYVQKVKEYIEKNNLEDIILVGHSFAGVVISKLLERIENKIKHIIFINAVILDNGESFFDFFPDHIKQKYRDVANNREDKSITPNPESLKAKLFNELEDEEKFKIIFNHLTPQPIKPYEEQVYLNGFKDSVVPMTYIFCTKDISFPPDIFDKILLKLPSHFKKLELESDHEAMFSHPKELADLILNI